MNTLMKPNLNIKEYISKIPTVFPIFLLCITIGYFSHFEENQLLAVMTLFAIFLGLDSILKSNERKTQFQIDKQVEERLDTFEKEFKQMWMKLNTLDIQKRLPGVDVVEKEALDIKNMINNPFGKAR